MELSERKKQILKQVCDAYISGGEPVGSKYLTQHGDFNLSSATIRNEMAELERMGFLEQPHTSAGRVPSTLGYRTYIAMLMENYRLSLEEVQTINELLDFKLGELGHIMEEASRVISELTNYTAVTMLKNSGVTVSRYEGVLIDEQSFLVVMICDDGEICNSHIRLDVPIDETVMKRIIAVLNSHLTGVPFDTVSFQLLLELEEEMGEYAPLVKPVLRSLCASMNVESKEEIHYGGITKLLSYPEFFNVQKARGVLEAFERKKEFIDRVLGQTTDDVNVFFGDESSDPMLPDSSFVFVPIKSGDRTIGGIGVIGPRRMDYKKVIASLRYFADGLMLEEGDRGEADKTDGDK